MTELPTPPDAASDPSALEVLRVWLISDTLQCSLAIDVFEDPATWGAVLADLARHVASAMNDTAPQADTLRLIRETFVQELAGDGSAPSGSTP